MEDSRNKVINLLANQSQNISKLLANQLDAPPTVWGGLGGGLPLRSLLAAVFGPPQIGGATGIRDPPSSLAVSS